MCQSDYVSGYDELLSKQGLVNNHTKNLKQLMTEFFKCFKGLFPPIMNELFISRSIPCSLRNGRELDIQWPISVHYGLEKKHKTLYFSKTLFLLLLLFFLID